MEYTVAILICFVAIYYFKFIYLQRKYPNIDGVNRALISAVASTLNGSISHAELKKIVSDIIEEYSFMPSSYGRILWRKRVSYVSKVLEYEERFSEKDIEKAKQLLYSLYESEISSE